jgi:hypothetical protein
MMDTHSRHIRHYISYIQHATDGQTIQDTYYSFHTHTHTHNRSLKHEKLRAGHSKRAKKQTKGDGQRTTQDEQESAHET